MGPDPVMEQAPLAGMRDVDRSDVAAMWKFHGGCTVDGRFRYYNKYQADTTMPDLECLALEKLFRNAVCALNSPRSCQESNTYCGFSSKNKGRRTFVLICLCTSLSERTPQNTNIKPPAPRSMACAQNVERSALGGGVGHFTETIL